MSLDQTNGFMGKKEFTTQDFVDEYQHLCQITGFSLVGEPSFVATNHGTFELQVTLKLVKNQ